MQPRPPCADLSPLRRAEVSKEGQVRKLSVWLQLAQLSGWNLALSVNPKKAFIHFPEASSRTITMKPSHRSANTQTHRHTRAAMFAAALLNTARYVFFNLV